MCGAEEGELVFFGCPTTGVVLNFTTGSNTTWALGEAVALEDFKGYDFGRDFFGDLLPVTLVVLVAPSAAGLFISSFFSTAGFCDDTSCICEDSSSFSFLMLCSRVEEEGVAGEDEVCEDGPNNGEFGVFGDLGDLVREGVDGE